MGNSSSTHNFNNDFASYEVNSNVRNIVAAKEYTLQQQPKHLQQQHGRFNEILRKSISAVSGVEEVSRRKVLPQVIEPPKLRPTTNGVILQAGGTISGRKGPGNLPYTMQRSRTLIYEPKNMPERSQPFISRSRTQLEMCYKSNLPDKRCAPSIVNEKSGRFDRASSVPALNAEASRPYINDGTTQNAKTPVKLNKYNKKRKAPLAPAIDRTNKPAADVGNRKYLPAAPSIAPSRRQPNAIRKVDNQKTYPGTNVTANTRLYQQTKAAPASAKQNNSKNELSHVTDQRKKSLDITTLRNSAATNDKRPMETKQINLAKEIAQVVNQRKKNLNVIPFASQTSFAEKKPTDMLNKIKKPIDSNNSKSSVASKTITAGDTGKHLSKIPQLQRTFFFGMNDLKNEIAAVDQENLRLNNDLGKGASNEKNEMKTGSKISRTASSDQASLRDTTKVEGIEEKPRQSSEAAISETDSKSQTFTQKKNSKIDPNRDFKQLDDFGLQVNRRPTIPRRQLSIPSFSPTAAWHNLLEEQQNLQPTRKCSSTAFLNQLNQRLSQPKELDLPINQRAITTKIRQRTPPEKDIVPQFNIKGKPKVDASFTRSLHSVWTPQQDLNDEEDEDYDDVDAFNSKGVDDNLKSWLFSSTNQKEDSPLAAMFGTSLHRDGSFQADTENINSLKISESNGIRSLKSKLNNKADVSDAQQVFNARYPNDNWMLHSAHHDAFNGSTLKEFRTNWNASTSIQPLTLPYMKGSKHCMYFPGHYESSTDGSSKVNKSETASKESLHNRLSPNKWEYNGKPVLQSPLSTAIFNNAFRSSPEKMSLSKEKPLDMELLRNSQTGQMQLKREWEIMRRAENDFHQYQQRATKRSELDFNGPGSSSCNLLKTCKNPDHKCDFNNNICRRADPEGAASS